jgi:hypothetical protein
VALAIEVPSELGGSWEAFSKDWCLGGSLASNRSEVAVALSTLARLLPGEVTRRVEESVRGLAVAAAMVDLGELLHTCEPAEGFSEVLAKVAERERSAYSELVLVAALRRLGYSARFAAPLNGKLLDACCDVDESRIYFEVVAPERSDASAEEQRIVEDLTAQVRRCVYKCRVEIEIFAPLARAAVCTIAEAVVSAPPLVWSEVGSFGRVRRTDSGLSLPPVFDGEGAQIEIAEKRSIRGDSPDVIIRWETADARAKRIFNTEYHHFSQQVRNVLVVNVSAIPDGMRDWANKIARLFQPTRNRKVGAVVLFEQGCLGPPESVRRRWRVLINRHAHLAVSGNLLSGFKSLDESESCGLERPERIVVA